MFDFDNVFTTYNPVLSYPSITDRIKSNIVTIDDTPSDNFDFTNYIMNPQALMMPIRENPFTQQNSFYENITMSERVEQPQEETKEESTIKTQTKSTQKKDTTTQKFNSDLARIDIEDLLKQEGITSVNGKKIKFGRKTLRPQNASYGVKNSNHKKRDPYNGFANARDISIPGGSDADYTKFRQMLLSNPRVVEWFRLRKWGIINELTPAVLRRTNGTGRHFHFGPDRWAVRTWNAWLQNPNISVTKPI